ncbi:MAG: hypothetical protein V1873_08030 [Verrucomicrobiota bacterium]
MTSSRGGSWGYLLALLLLVLLGAYLRLVRLDEYSLRADTINFWTICHSPLTAGDIIRKWGELGLDHPPFTLVAIKGMIDTFRLPVTHATLAVLPAVFGILCIPVLFLVGLRIGGRGFGLVLAGLLALHPMHIQISREPYHYSLLLLGSCLMLLGIVEAFLSVRDRREPGAGFYIAAGLGLLGLTLSTFTGWPVAFIEGLAILGLLWWRWKKQGAPARPLLVTVAVLGLLSLPTLLTPWGVPHFLGKLGGAEKEMASRVMAGIEGSAWTFFSNVATTFGWGGTPLRLGFTLLVLACAVFVIVRDRERRTLYGLCAGIVAADVVVFLATRSAINAQFVSRYVAALLPVWLVLLGAGIWGWVSLLPGKGGAVSAALGAGAVLLFADPAITSTRMRGDPLPYRDVQTWFDTHLPQRTLVLVDRWFDPWNELKVYNSTNVFFAFTIPNEPVDVYLKYNWRQTAKDFFARFPDAAYLEIAKEYWKIPTVGPWDWPPKFFRQHVVITNEAGLRLFDMGMLNRGEGRDKNMVEIFYNTRDDVLAEAREAGRPSVVLFGPEWGYTKLWREYNDFRDWRVLNSQASLDVYNLSDVPLAGALRIRGVAAGGSKRIVLGTQEEHVFPNGQVAEWRTGPLTLAPGLNKLVLSDPLGARAGVPLLVDAVTVESAERAEVKTP